MKTDQDSTMASEPSTEVLLQQFENVAAILDGADPGETPGCHAVLFCQWERNGRAFLRTRDLVAARPWSRERLRRHLHGFLAEYALNSGAAVCAATHCLPNGEVTGFVGMVQPKGSEVFIAHAGASWPAANGRVPGPIRYYGLDIEKDESFYYTAIETTTVDTVFRKGTDTKG